MLLAPKREMREWADPAAVTEVHDLLRDVAHEGTARAIGARGVVSEVAGKTGTTNESRVVWFVGYTPEILLGIRLAFDDGRSLGADAARLAVPLWSRILRRAEKDFAPREQKFSRVGNSQRQSAQ